ncbi:hypothetical protein CRUP_015931 [Coryphaenoides rupestris]|nr:hypothetical protein CRUP_015931 [Coryphaenoides rupestris]
MECDLKAAGVVFRLLAQLWDMESAFDGFFEKHHLKLLQYIQLLRYEKSFQEVRRPQALLHVLRELIETERVYVEELLSVLLDLESCMDTPERVGGCFLERKESFQMYECFCQNKLRSEALWRQFSDCAFFQECQKKLEHKLGLDSYLLKPVQRITKYQLLLKELLKCSTGSEDTSELQGALAAMLDLLKSVNDSMHQIAITGYEGELCELGRVLMQGSFSVWISHKRGPTRMKELARFKPMQRHLFLYDRALLFCKRREEHGERCDKTASYSFKHCLKIPIPRL